MWIKYDGQVKYNTFQEWYEVEINGRTVLVRGSPLDENDAFALAAMYLSNFDIELFFDGVKIDYLNDFITYEE